MRLTVWNYRISFLFIFCLAALCWALSRNAYTELQKSPAVTTFQGVGRLLAEEYEPMTRSEAQTKEPLPFTMWTQTDNQRAEGLGTGRTQNVSWIATKGDTRLVLPMMQTLDEGDIDGCLIDRATAEKLFGNANAVGNTVKMAGVEYTVRGVFDEPNRTMITQLARESAQVLENITVSGSENTDTFLMRHGLSAAVTVKSSTYLALGRIFYLLPYLALIMVAMMLLTLLQSSWRSYPLRYYLVTLGILAVGTGGLLLLFSIIPQTLIPTQWSDFEFWETAGKDFLQSVTDFVASAKLRPDLVWLFGVLQTGFGVLSAHLILCLYRLYRIHCAGEPMIYMQTTNADHDQLPSGGENTKLLSAVDPANSKEMVAADM